METDAEIPKYHIKCEQCGKDFTAYHYIYQHNLCSPGCVSQYRRELWESKEQDKTPHIEIPYLLKYISSPLTILWRYDGNNPAPYIRVPIKEIPKIEGTTCCKILKSHAKILKDDPERLSTNFIKNLSRCDCKKEIES